MSILSMALVWTVAHVGCSRFAPFRNLLVILDTGFWKGQYLTKAHPCPITLPKSSSKILRAREFVQTTCTELVSAHCWLDGGLCFRRAASVERADLGTGCSRSIYADRHHDSVKKPQNLVSRRCSHVEAALHTTKGPGCGPGITTKPRNA